MPDLINIAGPVHLGDKSKVALDQSSPVSLSSGSQAFAASKDTFESLFASTPTASPLVKASDVYQSEVNNLLTGRYSKVIYNADNEDIYGRNQGFGSKFVNSLGKMTGIAASTFVQGTVGAIDGLAEWASTGFSDPSKLWDNVTNKSMSKFTENLENWLPNYYTAKETNASILSRDNLLSSNFWFDKVMKNLGFSLGAAASGFTWGAVVRGTGILAQL